jgi:hypothetical protein
VAIGASDGVIGTRNHNRIKVRIKGGSEALHGIVRFITFNKKVKDIDAQLCRQK